MNKKLIELKEEAKDWSDDWNGWSGEFTPESVERAIKMHDIVFKGPEVNKAKLIKALIQEAETWAELFHNIMNMGTLMDESDEELPDNVKEWIETAVNKALT